MSLKKRIKKTGRKPAKRTLKRKVVTKKKHPAGKSKKVTRKPIHPIEKKAEEMLNPAEALRVWLQSNVDLINITGWERKAGLPKSTLRQISAGKRFLTEVQLGIVTSQILPELNIIVSLLKRYEKAVFGINLHPNVD